MTTASVRRVVSMAGLYRRAPCAATVNGDSGGGLALGGRAQDHAGDLGVGAQAHRRAPVARATAGVEVRAADLFQAGEEALLEAHHEAPGPDLPPVRVAGELEAHAALGGLVD